jgi:peptide chain release factor 2
VALDEQRGALDARLLAVRPLDDVDLRRHTSFASVWVYPVIDDRITIEIKESDCRIDTYRFFSQP